jgi:hypothetical protein
MGKGVFLLARCLSALLNQMEIASWQCSSERFDTHFDGATTLIPFFLYKMQGFVEYIYKLYLASHIILT